MTELRSRDALSFWPVTSRSLHATFVREHAPASNLAVDAIGWRGGCRRIAAYLMIFSAILVAADDAFIRASAGILMSRNMSRQGGRRGRLLARYEPRAVPLPIRVERDQRTGPASGRARIVDDRAERTPEVTSAARAGSRAARRANDASVGRDERPRRWNGW